MNINASIIDQRLLSVASEIKERANSDLNIKDDEKLKSLAFIYLCVKTTLDLDFEETFDCLTEGGGDFGIDAIHVMDELDGEFNVTLFQGKYKRDLAANSAFPENGLKALVDAIRHIFDPHATLHAINDRLKTHIEAIRSLIRDGFLPRVRAIACNNGLSWNASGQEIIDRIGLQDQVSWEHINHDRLIGMIQSVKPVNETLRLVGKAIVEDMHFSRVCIGRIPVTEVAQLIEHHGEKLLERNIRRYLGLNGNRVNEGIQATLQNSPNDFYFFNNGLTLVCSDFSYNALQNSDYQVRVENLQIVNGGQTSITIFKTLRSMTAARAADASVLVRIYKLPKDNDDLVLQITHATNSQNPVDLKDLRANDQIQRSLELSVESLGYKYRRKRTDTAPARTDITTGSAAEAVLSVLRRAPHQAKFFAREHFGKLYSKIFTGLNGAQMIVAVLLYRIAENHRRRPGESDPPCVRYGSCFIAMQMGRLLLNELRLDVSGITHMQFSRAATLIEFNGEAYFQAAASDVERALGELYGSSQVSMQQLSATFRRGDLIDRLENHRLATFTQ